MGIVLWILIGVAAGSLARFVMPGPKAGGIPVGILMGLAGAVTGGLVGAFMEGGVTSVIDVRPLLMAVCGTLYVLICYRAYALRF